MEKYVCEVCEWVYDPAIGDPENGIEPGTSFEDLPEDWVCPVCGVGKEEFRNAAGAEVHSPAPVSYIGLDRYFEDNFFKRCVTAPSS